MDTGNSRKIMTQGHRKHQVDNDTYDNDKASLLLVVLVGHREHQVNNDTCDNDKASLLRVVLFRL